MHRASFSGLLTTVYATINLNKNYIIGAFNHFFLPNARKCGYARLKDLDAQWTRNGLANGRFGMQNRLARNCGYARIGDLECAVDYHVLSSYTDFQLQFN